MTCTKLRHLLGISGWPWKNYQVCGQSPGPGLCERFHKEAPHSHHQDHLHDQESKGRRVSSKVVEDFFKRFAKTAEEVPPTHIYNYNDSGLKDDPGTDKAMFNKGVEHAKQIRDHTKSKVSIMLCGTASGKLLPPYIVYKATNCWESWWQRDPDGARFTATPSG
jgi:hypothetical protein